MKKRFFVALAVLTASVSYAQQKKQPPPPPAPPKVNVDKFMPPQPPPPPEAPAYESLPKDYQDFLNRNPSVKGLSWSENKVHVRLKSGKEEVYNLKNSEQLQKLNDKYGELPIAPPPPPAPPKPKTKTES